jgi:hypothetical protein
LAHLVRHPWKNKSQGGCATTGPKPTSPAPFTEPANSDSTLLIGRITLTCENFPANWHVEGEHKRGIVMDLKNVNTNEIIKIKSKGSDGLFYLLDTPGYYEIVKFEYGIKSGRYWSTLTITGQYLINIEKGIVNNLGDIHCTWTYVETMKRGHAKVQFNENYDEVKEWFQMTYPESSWNNVNWSEV